MWKTEFAAANRMSRANVQCHRWITASRHDQQDLSAEAIPHSFYGLIKVDGFGFRLLYARPCDRRQVLDLSAKSLSSCDQRVLM